MGAVSFAGGRVDMAMDAEQKRDADGKFGSGGGRTPSKRELDASHKKYAPSAAKKGDRVTQEWSKKHKMWSNVDPNSKPNGPRNTQEWDGNSWNDVAEDEAAPFPASMSGEAGRLARKQARDCMTGRYRP